MRERCGVGGRACCSLDLARFATPFFFPKDRRLLLRSCPPAPIDRSTQIPLACPGLALARARAASIHFFSDGSKCAWVTRRRRCWPPVRRRAWPSPSEKGRKAYLWMRPCAGSGLTRTSPNPPIQTDRPRQGACAGSAPRGSAVNFARGAVGGGEQQGQPKAKARLPLQLRRFGTRRALGHPRLLDDADGDHGAPEDRRGQLPPGAGPRDRGGRQKWPWHVRWD